MVSLRNLLSLRRRVSDFKSDTLMALAFGSGLSTLRNRKETDGFPP